MRFYCEECSGLVSVHLVNAPDIYEVTPCRCKLSSLKQPTPTNQEIVQELKQMAKEKLEEVDVDRLAGGYAMGLTHAAWVLSNKE